MPEPPPIFRTGFEAMRTRFEFVLTGRSHAHLESAAEAAREEVEACEARLSAFRPSSLISRINAAAGPDSPPIRLDPETFDLLATATRIHNASQGAFDPTIGPLMRTWGFRDAAPDPNAATPSRGMDFLRLNPLAGSTRLICEPVVASLDLGAIAKGHALDLAAACLRGHAVTCGLLHCGTSSVLAMDAPPGSDGWRIALRQPPDPGAASDTQPQEVSIGIVTLRNAGLGLSAPHGRLADAGEHGAVGHVMDPRTGRPVARSRLAAAVCETAAAADAWSTALLVAGTPGMSMGSDELLARVVVLDSGEILSSVIPPRAGSAGLGTEAGCSWCTLEVGA